MRRIFQIKFDCNEQKRTSIVSVKLFSMRKVILQYFKRPVQIFGHEKSAWQWMSIFFGFYGFGVLVYFMLGYLKRI